MRVVMIPQIPKVTIAPTMMSPISNRASLLQLDDMDLTHPDPDPTFFANAGAEADAGAEAKADAASPPVAPVAPARKPATLNPASPLDVLPLKSASMLAYVRAGSADMVYKWRKGREAGFVLVPCTCCSCTKTRT